MKYHVVGLFWPRRIPLSRRNLYASRDRHLEVVS